MINKKSFAAIALAGAITVTGATAFAATKSGDTPKFAGQRQEMKLDAEKMANALKTALGKLVTNGTMTQTQADAVQKDMPAKDGKGGPGGERKNPMSELVTAGTITQAQADSIREEMKTARDSGKTIKEVLDGLVTAGTITQAQEDAIVKAMPTKDGKAGPKGEPKGERKGPMSELVTAGTITQAQADAIQAAVKSEIDAASKTN